MSYSCEVMTVKTDTVDVGGGLRGIYAVGVLDYCMDQGIRFDIGYVYGTLCNSGGENPLDYPALRDDPADYSFPAFFRCAIAACS